MPRGSAEQVLQRGRRLLAGGGGLAARGAQHRILEWPGSLITQPPECAVPPYQRRIFWRACRHRLYAGVTLVAYLATITGLPIPAAVGKADGEPFPCQNHACGCLTAEQCWRGCCCFTPEQRWAWAREHHVQPPPYAEKPRSQSWRSERKRDQVGGPAASHPPACCVRTPGKPTPAKASCPLTSPRKAGQGWQLGVMAQRCQGLTTLWVASGAALPATSPLSWAPCLSFVEWVAVPEVTLLLAFHIPLDPPPRNA